LTSEIKSDIFQWLFSTKLSPIVNYLTSNQTDIKKVNVKFILLL